MSKDNLTPPANVNAMEGYLERNINVNQEGIRAFRTENTLVFYYPSQKFGVLYSKSGMTSICKIRVKQ